MENNIFKTNTDPHSNHNNLSEKTKIDIDDIEQKCREMIQGLDVEKDDFDKKQWINDFKKYIEMYDRILYSVISTFVFNTEEKNTGMILTNISSVFTLEKLKSEKELWTKLIKLYDHINLANQQLNSIDMITTSSGSTIRTEIDNKTKQTVENLRKNFSDDIQEKSKKLSSDFSKKINKQSKKIEDMEKNYITILGIFASIVLAFTTGIVFSSSVLENLHLASIYRVSFIVALLGLVLVNLIFGLFYYIEVLVRGNENPKVKPMVISNAILLVIIALIYISWCCGFVENRNSKVDNESHEKQTIIIIPKE